MTEHVALCTTTRKVVLDFPEDLLNAIDRLAKRTAEPAMPQAQWLSSTEEGRAWLKELSSNSKYWYLPQKEINALTKEKYREYAGVKPKVGGPKLMGPRIEVLRTAIELLLKHNATQSA